MQQISHYSSICSIWPTMHLLHLIPCLVYVPLAIRWQVVCVCAIHRQTYHTFSVINNKQSQRDSSNSIECNNFFAAKSHFFSAIDLAGNKLLLLWKLVELNQKRIFWRRDTRFLIGKLSSCYAVVTFAFDQPTAINHRQITMLQR